MLTRVLYGARTSLIIAGLGMLGSMSLGVSTGLAAVFGPPFAETVVMRLTDLQLAFPYVLLAIVITSAIRPSVPVVILLMVLAGWAAFARMVRGAAKHEASKEYVAAAQLVGASRWRVAWKYVLPNLFGPIVVLASAQMSAMIVFEATLSFLGLGVQPPTISWGDIMLDGKDLMSVAWWVTSVPGIALALTTASLILISNGLDRWVGLRARGGT